MSRTAPGLGVACPVEGCGSSPREKCRDLARGRSCRPHQARVALDRRRIRLEREFLAKAPDPGEAESVAALVALERPAARARWLKRMAFGGDARTFRDWIRPHAGDDAGIRLLEELRPEPATRRCGGGWWL